MSQLDSEKVRAAWAAARLSPLWESPNAHKPPAVPDAPHIWRWDEIRPLLEYACQETSPAAVERRVLQLFSPYSKSIADEFTVGGILAAVQCLLPGESARPHRHSMGAIRFVLEGAGAETIVDGKPCRMAPGDLILTPSWCWHEHRHTGTAPVLWLDALDVPIHAFFGTARFQPPPVMDMPETMDDAAFCVPNILPENVTHKGPHSPVFHYPYGDAVKALSSSPKAESGLRVVRYVNPLDAGPAQAFLDCLMVQVDAGETSKPTRTNSNGVMVVLEGSGHSRIGETDVNWTKGDIFTLPQWNWISHTAFGDTARMFMISDRDVLKRLNLHFEEVQA